MERSGAVSIRFLPQFLRQDEATAFTTGGSVAPTV